MMTFPVFGDDISLYVIADKPSILVNKKPDFEDLCEYLLLNAGLTVTGAYSDDMAQTEKLLQEKKVSLAIVSQEFFESSKTRLNLNKFLLTIPIYSNGPYESLHILAHKDTNILTLMDQAAAVDLFATNDYDQKFLDDKLFSGNDQIKKISWSLKETTDISTATKNVAHAASNAFVLLTGEEFFTINKLRTQDKELQNLKLIYTSPNLPTNILVVASSVDAAILAKLKSALLTMSGTLNGDLALKKIGLKGFAD